jgi:hypothetical protein
VLLLLRWLWHVHGWEAPLKGCLLLLASLLPHMHLGLLA